MLDRFKQFIQTQHLVPSGGKVLLAVSGGRDSVCMAYLFHAAHIPFAIAHCNFNLRPGDCDRDQDFVCQLAAHFGVDFHTDSFKTREYAERHSESIEEAARHLRYNYFEQLCVDNGYHFVATAHHCDDSIETFFLNLLRGTGIAGLHGIRPLSERGSMTLVRPMLCFTRQDIDSYILEHSLPYVEDVTNSQLDARRNRIRHRLIPLLRELYPSFDITMLGNMERLGQVEEIYDHAVDGIEERIEHHTHSPFGFDYTYIYIEELLNLDPFRPLVVALLRRYGFSVTTIDNIIHAIMNGQTGARFSSPSHMSLVDRDRLLIAGHLSLPRAPEVDISTFPLDKMPPSGLGHEGSNVEYIDADLVHQPLTVRRWQPGDRFSPLGMPHQRRLSDFLKDNKINVFEKDYVHVLVDADDRIVWVIGLRVDHRFRITDHTRMVLRLSVKA